MDLGLKSKNALISSGSFGVGIAIAKTLAEEGCNVAIGARGIERLERAAAELRTFGAKPEEIGSLAACLMSERSSYMTGAAVESCGGATKYI